MDHPDIEVDTTTKSATSPTTNSRDLNNAGVGESSECTNDPITNGEGRQSTRKRRSPKSEDAFSGATDSNSTDEQASNRKSLRRSSSGTGSEKRSMPEEMENEVSSSANAGVAKRQSTRTKLPRLSYLDEFKQGSEEGENAEIDQAETGHEDSQTDDTPSVNACASLLAMLDERSYQRHLLCDANGVCRTILQPLSLPWMHKGAPVARNMPFDIDDMPEILMVDDGFYTPHEDGPLGFGRFDVGQLRRGPLNTRLATSADSWCSASRRSNDPGVIEVSSVFLPLRPRIPSVLGGQDSDSSAPNDEGECEENASLYQYSAPAGELSLRCFEHSSKTKRRKIEEVRSCTRRQLMSVKVNSSSSRLSICNDLKMDSSSRCGKLLEANLPAEVQNGRYMSAAKAQGVAENLGTYDWRHGLSSTSTTGKNAKSTSCGRTRLMWTEKSPHEMPQKVFFTSLLTGVRLEGNTQKRPRAIKVAIRVGGEIFGSESQSDSSAADTFVNNFPVDVPRKNVNHIYEHPRAECVLDDEELKNNVLNETSRKGNDRNKTRERSALSYPVLECLPDNNGLIGVICSSPGRIPLSSVHECLNHAAKETDMKCCTVCWAPDLDENSKVYECSECGVCAHLRCCYNKGETQSIPNNGVEARYIWKCAVCCYKSTSAQQPVSGSLDASTTTEQAKKSKRRSRPPQWLKDSHIDDPLLAGKSDNTFGEIGSHGVKCVVCPYHGGAMSRVKIGDDPVWIHEVCRVWLKGSLRPPPIKSVEAEYHACVLCGQGERAHATKSDEEMAKPAPDYVVKCASSRCQVHFHPMCALLSKRLTKMSIESQTAANIEDPVELSKQRDVNLCACFTLTALDCEVARERTGKDPGTKDVVTLPIGFCGIHNPSREAAFRGLYPAGKYVTPDVMKIPPLV